MSTFWSLYVTILTLGSLAALFWLIFATRKGEKPGQTVQTMGHAFDGIEEYDNPLPKWWFLLFVGTLFFALGYLVFFPGLGNWSGIWPGYQGGWTSTKEWQREMDKADAAYGPLFAKLAATPIEELAKDPQALKIGNRLFANYCSICHGSDAKGAHGFPDLTDENWRWGGDAASIKQSILHGRQAVMAPWGGVIGEDGVKNVAAYVRGTLAKLPLPENHGADLAAGQQVYSTVCIACHGPEGKGMTALGAPDLTAADGWIYGSSLTQLQQTVRHGRTGQMPAQADFLGEDKVHVLAAYIYSLSHGR